MSSRAAIAAAIAVVLLAIGLGAALRFDANTPPPRPTSAPEPDEQPAETTGNKPPKVRKDPEDPAQEPDSPQPDLALPTDLQKLPVKIPEKDYGELETAGELDKDTGAKVIRAAYVPAIQCLVKTRRKHPDARARLKARLLVGPGPDGKSVVQNLELVGKETGHPALVACVDKALRSLALELPSGSRGTVTAPLVLGPPPGDFDPEGDKEQATPPSETEDDEATDEQEPDDRSDAPNP